MKMLLKLSVPALAICLCSCASTAPNANFQDSVTSGERISKQDTVSVVAKKSDSVSIQNYEMQRLEGVVKSKVDKKKASVDPTGQPRDLQLDVTITRYDKGSAFARSMLAGLGQIHIDTLVIVSDKKSNKQLAEFKINKTFAWGGLYGGMTTVEDVETGLAEGIADAVCNGK